MPSSKPSKRKYKPASRTPITIALPKAHIDAISKIPRISLKRIKDGIGDITDWYNLLFRLKVGLYLAEKIYEQETVDGLNAAIYHCLPIGERWLVDKKISASQEELEEIEVGLEAVDQMHFENLRRQLLDAYKATREALKAWVA